MRRLPKIGSSVCAGQPTWVFRHLLFTEQPRPAAQVIGMIAGNRSLAVTDASAQQVVREKREVG
jgi:hypothetical protein